MNLQTLRAYKEALALWDQLGRKGTMPKKVRANSSARKRSQRSKRVKRDRLKRKSLKSLQSARLSRGQEIRTGRR